MNSSSSKFNVKLILPLIIIILYTIFVIVILYQTFTPKGDATLYSSVIYELLRGAVPTEKYYIVPLLPIVLFSKLLHVEPPLILIIVDILLRIVLTMILFYIFLRQLGNADLKTIILATFVFIGIISLNIPPTFIQKFFGASGTIQFTYYKIFTDFNSPETYKLASIALFLLAILILDVRLWLDYWKIMILCTTITYYYPGIGLLTLLSYSLSISVEEKLTHKRRVILFLKNTFFTTIIFTVIFGLQSIFIRSFELSSYINFANIFQYFNILPIFIIFVVIFVMKYNTIKFLVYKFKNIIKMNGKFIQYFSIFVKALSLIFSIIALRIYDSKFFSPYYINIQYLSAYIIATLPITLVSLSNSHNNFCKKSTREEPHISLSKKFITIFLSMTLCYYLFSLIYIHDIIFFLKGSIVLNIFILVHIFQSVTRIFQRKHLNAQNAIFLLTFTFLSLFGFYENLKLWSSVDVANFIGITSSIFDNTHKQIESLKKIIGDKNVLLISSDIHTYHLLMLHGFPNLIHPETISLKDLPQDFCSEVYFIQVKDRIGIIANIYENIPHTNHLIYFVKGITFDNKTFVSNVVYCASYVNGSLQRLSNYPVIHCSNVYEVKKVSNNIFIIEAENVKIEHDLSRFIINDYKYHLFVFILLSLLYTDAILYMIIYD